MLGHVLCTPRHDLLATVRDLSDFILSAFTSAFLIGTRLSLSICVERSSSSFLTTVLLAVIWLARLGLKELSNLTRGGIVIELNSLV